MYRDGARKRSAFEGDCARGRSAFARASAGRGAALGDRGGDGILVRRGFLERLPENARTVALARQWLGDGDPASG